LTVAVDVKNTSGRAGDEVVQLYTRELTPSVPRPAKELRGFQRITLQPGEEKTVRFLVAGEKLAFYDEKKHAFVVEPGKYEIEVGASSADIRQRTSIRVVTGSQSENFPPVAVAK